MAAGSNGAIHGAKIASTTKSVKKIVPSSARGWERSIRIDVIVLGGESVFATETGETAVSQAVQPLAFRFYGGQRFRLANGTVGDNDSDEPAPVRPPKASVDILSTAGRGTRDAPVKGPGQHILLVSPFFYPEPISTGKANRSMAEAFAAEGHAVTVICSHPLYPSWRPERSEAGIHGMDILRGGAWLRYPKAMPLRRMVLEAWFAMYALRRIWRLRRQADVVVSVLPPSLFALVLRLVLPRRVRQVAVVHDLQGVLAAQKHSVLRRAIIHTIRIVEKRVFRMQDACIFFSSDMARAAREAYGIDASRVAVQYPFVTLACGDVSEGKAASENLAGILPPDTLHVVYSGALGYKQNSRQLVAFLEAAAERFPEVQFHMFSGGPLFDELRARHKRPYGPRVRFHPLVAENDLGELYARSAIQVVPQAEGTEDGALPSKLPNLMAAGVYLLAISSESSEVSRLIQRAGTGSVVERWDLDLFLSRLGHALNHVRQETASARRERVADLLGLFSVENVVRLVLGEPSHSTAATMPQPESERLPAPSGARG